MLKHQIISHNGQSASACWCNKQVINGFASVRGDNPLIKARGLSSRTDAHIIQ